MELGRTIIRLSSRGGLAIRCLAIAIAAVTVAGCATQPPAQDAVARRHAANIAAATGAGYKVIIKNDQTMFCPSQAPTGSHLATCLTEREWEMEQASAFNWKVFSSSEPFTVVTREGY
jgi:hypothetical protein